MALLHEFQLTETLHKPPSLEILDRAYDPQSFKFSQIIRYLQDQRLYCQEMTTSDNNEELSTSPLPVDPKLAYEVHTGRYTRTFKTQGDNCHALLPKYHQVVKLTYPAPSPREHYYSQQTMDCQHRIPYTGVKLPPSPRMDGKLTASQESDPQRTQASRNALRKQVWRLPQHVATFAKYKRPVKLPPITISKLMKSI